MNKKIWTAIGAASFLAATALPALAAETVTATVTPQIIAVSVTDGDVDYKILDISESNDTNTGTADETQTITNDSNVSANIALRSSDAAKTGDPGVTNWTLAGTIGSDVFVHSYEINAGAPSWTAFPFDGTFDNINTSSVVILPNKDNTATLDLKLDMPDNTTDVSVHTITITVVASAT